MPAELEEFQPSMRCLLIDESRWPREKLLAAGRNAVATFLRLHQSDPQEIQKLVLEESGLDSEDAELMRDLLAWISLVLLPSRAPETPVPELRTLDELKTFMEKDMETWSEMLLKKGRAGPGQARGDPDGHPAAGEAPFRHAAQRLRGENSGHP